MADPLVRVEASGGRVAAVDDLGTPLMRVGVYHWVVAWDHLEERSWILARSKDGASAESRVSSLLTLLQRPRVPARAASGLGDRDSDSSGGRASTYPIPGLPGVRSTFSKEHYLGDVERVRE